MGVLGYLSLSLGTIYYNMYLKEKECRTLLKYACFLGLFSSFFGYIFALRWNTIFGISDTVFIILTDVVIGTLSLAYTNLPIMVLFAKITPNHIEASCFAFLTGTLNFCNGVLAPMVGTKINDYFVGVTSKDLDKFHVLCSI